MELIGDQPSTNHGTIHYGFGAHRTDSETYRLDEGTFHAAFHTFTLTWQPGKSSGLSTGNNITRLAKTRR